MAAPTTRKFGQIKVYVGNGASPEVFATPCGFTDKGVTSISRETGKITEMEDVKRVMYDSMREVFGYEYY